MNLAFLVFKNRAITQGTRMILLILPFMISPTLVFPIPIDSGVEQQNYYFEFLCFKAGKGEKSFLEIFCQIPTQNLQFIKINDEFCASYELSIALYDWNIYEVARSSYSDTIKVPSFKDIGILKSTQLIRFTFLVKPGDYVAQVRLTDLETRSYISFKKNIKVPDYGKSNLKLSDLQIASSITPTDEESILVKSGRKIIPNVPRIFGPGLDLLYVYLEIYNLHYSPEKPNQELHATVIIQNKKGVEVKSEELRLDKPGNSCALSVGIPVEGLESGQYKLILRVEDRNSAQKAQKSTHFNIVEPFYKFTIKEYNKFVRQLSYIASHSEITYLKSLPKQERLQGIYKFWQERDPTPGTEQNEFMIEFYRRLQYANKHFFGMSGEGWETAQGKIYIKNGPPDYIDHVSSGMHKKSYEVWEYFDLNRKYIFVEDWKLGEYRLLKPDDTWGKGFSFY
ncbi:MAG: GWxTD domain-containing protein [bacterium]